MLTSVIIGRNTFRLALASLIRKVLTFVYFVIVARYAGVQVTGLFYLVICYGLIFHIAMDFGLTSTFIRRASENPVESSKFLSETLSLKLLLATLGGLLCVCLVNVMGYPAITKNLIYIVLMTMILRSFSLSFYAPFRVLQQIQHESRGLVIGNLLALAGVGSAVYFQLSPYFLILSIALDGLFNFLLALHLILHHLKFSLRLSLSRKTLFEMLPLAIPFALSALFIDIYSIDTVLLSKFMDETFVGWYSVPSKITASARFLPVAAGAVLFPAFSVLYQSNPKRMARTFLRSEDFMIWLVFPLAMGGVIIAPELVRFLFGVNYENSILPLRIMIPSLIPAFLSYPIFSVLNACDRQRSNTINLSMAITVHVMLAVILIPRYDVLGAAISWTTSNVLLFLLGIYAVYRAIDVDWRGLYQSVIRVSVAATFMAGVVLLIRPTLHFALEIIGGAVVYVAISYFLEGYQNGGFRKAEADRRWNEIASLVRQA